MIQDHEIEAYRCGGRVISRLRRAVPAMVHEGGSVRELCEWVESEIVSLGGKPAFPCNVSVNEVVAHYTSPRDDQSVLPGGSLVKVDFGVHIDGYINDSAITVSLDPAYHAMVEAAEEALRVGIGRVAGGVKLSEVGGQIESVIKRYGYRPIRNLSGHQMKRYSLHAGKLVPNVSGFALGRFESGSVYAIEPFVTAKKAAGEAEAIDQVFIYQLAKSHGALSEQARRVVDHVEGVHGSLPFASRWLYAALDKDTVDKGLPEAVRKRCVVGYPVLVEASGGIVAQAEHTVLVNDNGCEKLTA